MERAERAVDGVVVGHGESVPLAVWPIGHDIPVMGDEEQRYRNRSLWLDGLAGRLTPRPSLGGDADYDVCIVGAGFTGLWTAYSLVVAQPDLRVIVLEHEIAGFGASGRNGGWVSAGIAGVAARYAKRAGREAVVRAERATFEAVDEIGRVVAAEGIDCGFHKGGVLMVASDAAQQARLRKLVDQRHALGWGHDDVRLLDPDERAARPNVAGTVEASFSPHGARVDPARLVRGLAEACERRGVRISEKTTVSRIEPGIVRTSRGMVGADHVVRATEAFTIALTGEARRYLPLYSLMIATEPLPDDAFADLRWDGGETIADLRHLFFYAQRTTDNRIAIGGRGAPYRLGSPLNPAYERMPKVRERLERTVRERFPQAAGARITHHWGGPLGVPRDWCMAIAYDRETGVGSAGGYGGHGVVAASISGRTMADLILGRDTDLTTLPWVGHRQRNWEPEPLRFIASRAIVGILGSADRIEPRLGHTARRVRLVAPFMPPR